MRAARRFVREHPHLVDGGFEIRHDAADGHDFSASRTDRPDHSPPERFEESVFLAHARRHVQQVLNLSRIGEQHHACAPSDNRSDRGPQRLEVVRERPAVDGNAQDVCPALFESSQEGLVWDAVFLHGHALAHHAYVVTDRTRGDDPWFVLTGDALLIGDAGRPDLHAHGDHATEDMARQLYRSLHERLLALPDHLLLYPAHYSGSVCGRGLSANPISTIGFERRENPALRFDSEDEFVDALLRDIPPTPAEQAEIVAANRAGSRTAARA